ncbi:MAG: DUF3846 domain-containing protein [Clostridiaceae bacterium]|nr:DUF3846 domain-containing protein [Clostridiaceae bacterium]
MNTREEPTFELAVLFGKSVLFSDERIEPSENHQGLYLYEIRHAKDNPSKPQWLEDNVSADCYGTIMSKEPIEIMRGRMMDENHSSTFAFRPIENGDFRIDDYAMVTIPQYLAGEFELTPEPETNIRVIIVEPWELPREAIIPNTLQAKQEIVEGLIEAVYPFEDPVALVCNDEGKLIGLPLNRRVGGDIIAGTFIICGLDDRNSSFASLTDEQVKRYQEIFKTIEIYLPKGAIPVAEAWHKGKKKDDSSR